MRFGSPIGASSSVAIAELSGPVSLATGTTVGLASGATVGLAAGSAQVGTVGLQTGTAVGLAAGAQAAVTNASGTQLATYGNPQLVYSGTVAGLNGQTLPSTPLVAGAHTLAFFPTNATINTAGRVTAKGAQSGATWAPTFGWAGNGPTFFPFDSSADDQLTFTVGGVFSQGSCEVWALAEPIASASEGAVGTSAYPGQPTGNVTMIGGLAGSGADVGPIGATSTGTNTFALQTIDSSDASPGNPIPSVAGMIGGSDGTNMRALLTDTSGRQAVIGGAASGAATAGNPVLIAGANAGNAQTIATNTSGQIQDVVADPATNAFNIEVSTNTPTWGGPTTGTIYADVIAISVNMTAVATAGAVNLMDASGVVIWSFYLNAACQDSMSIPFARKRTLVSGASGCLELAFAGGTAFTGQVRILCSYSTVE